MNASEQASPQVKPQVFANKTSQSSCLALNPRPDRVGAETQITRFHREKRWWVGMVMVGVQQSKDINPLK